MPPHIDNQMLAGGVLILSALGAYYLYQKKDDPLRNTPPLTREQMILEQAADIRRSLTRIQMEMSERYDNYADPILKKQGLQGYQSLDEFIQVHRDEYEELLLQLSTNKRVLDEEVLPMERQGSDSACSEAINHMIHSIQEFLDNLNGSRYKAPQPAPQQTLVQNLTFVTHSQTKNIRNAQLNQVYQNNAPNFQQMPMSIEDDRERVPQQRISYDQRASNPSQRNLEHGPAVTQGESSEEFPALPNDKPRGEEGNFTSATSGRAFAQKAPSQPSVPLTGEGQQLGAPQRNFKPIQKGSKLVKMIRVQIDTGLRSIEMSDSPESIKRNADFAWKKLNELYSDLKTCTIDKATSAEELSAIEKELLDFPSQAAMTNALLSYNPRRGTSKPVKRARDSPVKQEQRKKGKPLEKPVKKPFASPDETEYTDDWPTFSPENSPPPPR